MVVNVINILKGAFLLVTDNRRSLLDSPFCVTTQHRKFEFSHHRQSKKISNAQELTMQLSHTLSSAIAQIKVSNSLITNHTKKILPQRPPPFFQFLYNLKINFLVDCFNGGVFPGVPVYLDPGQLDPPGVKIPAGSLTPGGGVKISRDIFAPP